MKLIQKFKEFFADRKTKKARSPFTKKHPSLGLYSFHPLSGVIREERGTWYVEAASLRNASRHFKREVEKKTGRKVEIEKRSSEK